VKHQSISLHRALRNETRRQAAVADLLRQRRADHQHINTAAQDVHRWQVKS
jgi:hypothetical protein